MRRKQEQRKTKPATARGTRTAVQGGAGYAVAELVDTFIDLNDTQLAALAVVLTIAFSWIQTTLEDWRGVAFLRDIPEPDAPVADQNPPA
jgi:hypothetical protein